MTRVLSLGAGAVILGLTWAVVVFTIVLPPRRSGVRAGSRPS